jgi:hypothetical protein
MAGDSLLHLGPVLADQIRFSRDGADGNDLRCSSFESGGACVRAAGESPETGVDTFGEADFHFERIVFQAACHIRAGVSEASGGAEAGGGWNGLAKENLAALEIPHAGDGAVGVRDFRQAHTGESRVEFSGGFYFWKLHNSEIKLSGKCGKRLEKKNKGCKADHASGFIHAC